MALEEEATVSKSFWQQTKQLFQWTTVQKFADTKGICACVAIAGNGRWPSALHARWASVSFTLTVRMILRL
jgi:hypothetical protein